MALFNWGKKNEEKKTESCCCGSGAAEEAASCCCGMCTSFPVSARTARKKCSNDLFRPA